MICRIHGLLEHIEDDIATIDTREGEHGFVYRVIVSPYTAARLGGSLGQPVTLHTLHYLESQNQGASFTPRLAGFLTHEDRRFFELFTTTKGIGFRKALRAMSLSTEQLAAAIADRDVSMLQTLPEIGKRTAETIIAHLSGKVEGFVGEAGIGATSATSADAQPASPLAKQALQVLVQLGENRAQAQRWIEEALRQDDERPQDVQQLLERVYAIREA